MANDPSEWKINQLKAEMERDQAIAALDKAMDEILRLKGELDQVSMAAHEFSRAYQRQTGVSNE